MEKQTVYAKLKKMESFIQQVPEGIRTLYKFRVIHTESDFVGLAFHTSDRNFVGMACDVIKEIQVRDLGSCLTVDVITAGANITLYGNVPSPMSHTSLL